MATKKKVTKTKKKSKSIKAKKSKTTKLKSTDNRDDHRIPINLLVDYRTEGHYLFDFCKDLGTGGVFIQTNSPLPKGSTIDLTFTIPDSKETLRTKGEIIWVQQSGCQRSDQTAGMGVEFHQFDENQREILQSFVERYHGDRFQASTDKQSA